MIASAAGPAAAPAGYVGRLAPSPTGRFHLGNFSTSALAAVRAAAAGGRLVLRIEDLDLPRCVAGADVQIVRDLEWLGISWESGDSDVVRQSTRGDAYAAVLDAWRAVDRVYPCFCSRRDIGEASAPHGPVPAELRYPGTCGRREPSCAWAEASTREHAVRVRAAGPRVFDDVLADGVCFDADDFVVRRRDGLFAYQLAVVVDDVAAGVTEVVRGRDLLDATARQLAVYDALGAPPPRWCHVPLLLDARGERLSKRAASMARPALEEAGWTGPLLLGALSCVWGWRDRLETASVHELAGAWQVGALAAAHLRVPDALFDGPRAFEAEQRTWRRGEAVS